MEMKQIIAPMLVQHLMKASAVFQEPEVKLLPGYTVCIEESGIIVEFSFPDNISFTRFKEQLAEL